MYLLCAISETLLSVIGVVLSAISVFVIAYNFYNCNLCGIVRAKKFACRLYKTYRENLSHDKEYIIVTCSGNSVNFAFDIYRKLKNGGFKRIEFICLPIYKLLSSYRISAKYSFTNSNKHVICFDINFFRNAVKRNVNFIIIDDVSTTASTLLAISRHLQKLYGVSPQNITTGTLIVSKYCYGHASCPAYFGTIGALNNFHMSWRTDRYKVFWISKFRQKSYEIAQLYR